MINSTKNVPASLDFDKTETLLSLVGTLAHHLAIELDLNYEDDQAPQLAEELAILEAATAALLYNGLLAPETVYHTMHRFGR